MEIAVVFEAPNVAMSDGPLGTVLGVQLAPVFQLPFVGFRFHVALPAEANCALNTPSEAMSRRVRRELCIFIFPFNLRSRAKASKQSSASGKGFTSPPSTIRHQPSTSAKAPPLVLN